MDNLHISYWSLTLLILILDDFNHFKYLAEGLKCNYCFNADLVQDCHYTSVECRLGEVCVLDSAELTYTIGAKRNQNKTVWQYKMGCLTTISCKDGASYGPGPYGYITVDRKCCCSDLCTEPDGVGKERYDHCPNAFDNITNVASSLMDYPSASANYASIYTLLVSFIFFFS